MLAACTRVPVHRIAALLMSSLCPLKLLCPLARSSSKLVQEQLRVDLAGRAAERLLLGEDELSSLSMASINHARSVVHMLVLGSAMADNIDIGPQMLSQPDRSSETSTEMAMYIGAGTPLETLTIAQFQMEHMLHEVCSHLRPAPQGRTAFHGFQQHGSCGCRRRRMCMHF
jgi:hypothetical protein